MNRKLYTVLLSTIFACSLVQGQNLDPTVHVNRAYEGKLIEVSKPALDMAVPDSVMRFDLDFDYSVFDSPYQGSYEFTPYSTTMRPAPQVKHNPVFYFNVGAGYTLHPVMDLLWSPHKVKNFSFNVYGTHRSYFGNYHNMHEAVMDNQEVILKGNGEAVKGYEMHSKAGADVTYDHDRFRLLLAGGYWHDGTDNWYSGRNMSGGDFRFKAMAKPRSGKYIHYDVDAAFRIFSDNVKYHQGEAVIPHEPMMTRGKEYALDVTVGPILSDIHKIMFNLRADGMWTDPQSQVSLVSAGPAYHYDKGRLHLKAGVRLSKVAANPEEENVWDGYQTKGNLLHPDIDFSFDVVRDAMSLYAGVGGGQTLETYSSLVKRNPWADRSFHRYVFNAFDFTSENISMDAGIKGRIGAAVSYDIRGGYVDYRSAPLDGVVVLIPQYPENYSYFASQGYASYSKVFLAMDMSVVTENLVLNADMCYNWFDGIDDKLSLFTPSALTASLDFRYNWKKRLYAGASCEFASSRTGYLTSMHAFENQIQGQKLILPWYADLGLDVEYVFSRKLSFWAHGGNLLNMAVQRTPLYAEKGISFTAGICLKL